jgi:hypothetical protein
VRYRPAAWALVVLAACSNPRAASEPVGREVHYNPEPSRGPYVVVAVDNHFHDIHPVDDPVIRARRAFIVKNEGRNLHNFTVVGTHVSVDIRPGHKLVWRHIGRVLSPGTYHVFCKYHAHVNPPMRGVFTVVGDRAT